MTFEAADSKQDLNEKDNSAALNNMISKEDRSFNVAELVKSFPNTADQHVPKLDINMNSSENQRSDVKAQAGEKSNVIDDKREQGPDRDCWGFGKDANKKHLEPAFNAKDDGRSSLNMGGDRYKENKSPSGIQQHFENPPIVCPGPVPNQEKQLRHLDALKKSR
jgi:hypothetical protein